MRTKKRFAQHWLSNDKIIADIIEAAELSHDSLQSEAIANSRVLEIGPGTGILTRQLLPKAQSVVAVEIDRDLCKKLVKKLGQIENFLLLQGDILSLDLDSLLARAPAIFQQPNKVVANIPYNITGPILEKLLGKISMPAAVPYDLIVLMVQKEVGDRLYASPGSRAFGALSVRVQYLASCELICDVPANCFYPKPKVDSAVVRLRPRPIERPADDPRKLEQLVKLGFSSKRKMLHNNLKGLKERDRLTQILEQLDINPQARAEDLGVAQWVALSNALA
ncbi:MAG: 16S rRNA (adenine(1518)-N(6)/adenine(1519)-N(6))-dimethyltransferase RsmA [Oscillatoria sp. SIO1A7]|nr:16S rRNA (adenine(1518)-N(6)/adenine(1519)-N(6))-dimethyltransferase RsmA [Oscillatoria sp. SIO1A7]